MKIAILTSLFFHEVESVHGKDKIIFGGAERLLRDLCHLLQSMGHQVTVYQTLNQNIMKDGVLQKRQHVTSHIEKEFEGIPIINLADTDNHWNYSTNSKLNMMFNEVSIHDDLRIFFATFLAWPHAPMNSISISHGIYWDYVHHFYATCTEAEKKEFLKRHLYGFYAPDVCVAVDSNIRKSLASMVPGMESRIQIIYNYVDTKQFVPKEKKDWEGINVLYPRRLTVLRGCNEFIKASSEYPQYNYLSVGQAAGDGLNKSAKDWGETRQNIKFISREMDNMVDVYQGADISVIPTRACEGLSLSLLESQSCGLPIITTNVGGLGDSVIPGYNALVYEPHHGGLGELIDYMANNEDMRKTFGRRNREIVQECFDIEIWRNRWRMLLKSFGG